MALAISELTSGANTASDPASTAAINPASGSLTLLFVGVAAEGGGAVTSSDTIVPTGARGTWTQLAFVNSTTEDTNRRGYLLFAGTGSVTNEAISIDTTFGTGTWTETNWSVIEVTGQDTGTPYDTAVKAGATSGTSTSTLGDVGTVDAGDAVVFGAFHEDDEAISATGWTALSAVSGGSDIRTNYTFYDDSTPDETPLASWTTSGTWGAIAVVVNVDAGAPASVGLLPFLLNH